MSIAESRAIELLRNATAVSQKVYDSVPVQDAWTSQEIMADISRRDLSLDYRIVQGCLNSLKDAGLVREPTKNCFIRESIREKATKPLTLKDKIDMAKQTQQTAIPLETAVTPDTAMDIIGKLAERANALQAHMQAMTAEAQKLSAALADAAVTVQEQIEANQADSERLKALQTAFKSLGLTA